MADESEKIGAGALARGIAKGFRELQSAAPYADSPHAQAEPATSAPTVEAAPHTSVIEETLDRATPSEPGRDDPELGIDR